MQHLIPAVIAPGDHIVAEFFARCISATAGQCHFGALLEMAFFPWTILVDYFDLVGTEWRFYQVPLVASTAFSANETHLTFRLGYENQSIQLHPVRVMNYEPLENQSRLDCLPNTTELLSKLEIFNVCQQKSSHCRVQAWQ